MLSVGGHWRHYAKLGRGEGVSAFGEAPPLFWDIVWEDASTGV